MKYLALLLIIFIPGLSKSDFSEIDLETLDCMALNIYHEARGSTLEDKIAVSDVVINRVNDDRFPNTVCEVVKDARMSNWWKNEKGKDVPLRNKCQFSWFCDGKSDEPKDPNAWLESQHIAYQIIHLEKYIGVTDGATHYHATYVNPNWANEMKYVDLIGSHKFYRWE